ncbi:amidase [Trichoderma cornu-damae]|uniref:Amidase n=1 Tax=Trichoderma cornu-damae TaxID=654480 RepID=A0A9P8QKY1_9HYPO|nr:amidase [Trichoderma cornu-damae]
MPESQDHIRLAISLRDASLDKSVLFSLSQITALPQDVTSVPRSSGLLSDAELQLTEDYDATALLEMLAAKKITAVELLSAFRKRATIAQQCTNCLTELLAEAIYDAEACDEHLALTGRLLGPLHGIPLSLKNQIGVASHLTNAGFVAWINNTSHSDAAIVKTFRKLGAVVFARTNQPQAGMHLETSNNIYGTTVNPRNRQLTAGGSTGGEAALMGMSASVLGIGGDIGGSIRVPAAFNGLYGFTPTPGRFSGEGVVVPTPGHDAIAGTLGPFARSLRDVELFCKAYSSTLPWIDDVSLIPGNILSPAVGRQLDETRPLKVGLLTDDGVVSPLPPVRAAMRRVADALRRSVDVQVVSFSPMAHARAWSIVAANYFEDGGANIRAICERGGEPVLPLTEWIIGECQRGRAAVAASPEGLREARDGFRREYSDHWNQFDVDVVLAPVYPSVAGPHGATRYWGYTAIWNLLQYPAVAMPASRLVGDATAAELNGEYVPKNELERHYWDIYSADDAAGLPVGVQVVGKRYHERMVLQAARVIERALLAK